MTNLLEGRCESPVVEWAAAQHSGAVSTKRERRAMALTRMRVNPRCGRASGSASGAVAQRRRDDPLQQDVVVRHFMLESQGRGREREA